MVGCKLEKMHAPVGIQNEFSESGSKFVMANCEMISLLRSEKEIIR